MAAVCLQFLVLLAGVEVKERMCIRTLSVGVCIELKVLVRQRMSEHVLLGKVCGLMREPSDSIVCGSWKEW